MLSIGHDLQGESHLLGRIMEEQILTGDQDYMKGYISHERQTVVLAKTNPFPPLTSISR